MKRKRKKKVHFRSRRTKKSFKKIMHWTVGLVLVPTLWATVKSTFLLFPSIATLGLKNLWLYLAGAGSLFLFSRWVHKPMWFYVFAHELTHALSGLLSGAKIHSFKASSKGGEVRLSKSNGFVALSPYIFPLYTMFVLAIFAALQHWWPQGAKIEAFQFLLGFTLAFHWMFTWEAVHRAQPDLKVMGHFLSTVLILFGNVLILGLLAVTLFKTPYGLADYGKNIFKETVHVWMAGAEQVKALSETKFLNET